MSKFHDSSSPHSGPENFPVVPGLELVTISPLGAIFRARQQFEPGTSLAMGVHLLADAAISAPRFLDLRGTVVECHRDRSLASGGGTSWQVTLLFHNLSDTDSSALAAAAQSGHPVIPDSTSKPAAPPPPARGASFFGFDGFPPVCGLN